MPAAEAARRIHLALLDTIVASEEGARGGVDPEFLHDFRVAVRRTRSCFSQLEGVLEPSRVNGFRREFKWLGAITGPTRDLDVHLLKMPEFEASLPGPVRADLAPLKEFLARHKRFEQRQLAAALDSPRYRKLIGDWVAFLEQPSRQGASPPAARRPVIDVAAERIARVHARVLKKGRAIDDGSPARSLHRLRIECKKLRYLLEFFRSLYDPADLEPLVKQLRRLQDNLGEFNDCQVQQAALRRFAQEMEREDCASAESLLAMGRLVDQLHIRQRRARKRFARRFRQFSERDNLDRLRRLLAHGRTMAP